MGTELHCLLGFVCGTCLATCWHFCWGTEEHFCLPYPASWQTLEYTVEHWFSYTVLWVVSTVVLHSVSCTVVQNFLYAVLYTGLHLVA